jgi:hypothetical protein
MATPRKTAAAKTAASKTTFGADAEVIEVVAISDKSDLLDVPFIVREAWLQVSPSEVEYLTLTVETERKGLLTILDSSTTGIRAQMLERPELERIYDSSVTEKITGLNLFAPRGLRVSEFKVVDRRGKTKNARTYYIA